MAINSKSATALQTPVANSPLRVPAARPTAGNQSPPLADLYAGGNLAMQNLLRKGVLRARLEVSSPGDALEHEADAAAERCDIGVQCSHSTTSCGGCKHQVIQRKPISPSTTGVPSISSAPSIIQPKLSVSQPGDPLEQEADRQSETAVSTQAPGRCEGVTCPGGGCSACHHPMAIQRKTMPGSSAPAAPAVISGTLHSGGRPLDPPVRSVMETALGADFSTVRVYTDPQAAESAKSIEALAYTIGPDVVFNSGRYAPETREGRKLLAHELAHVTQQGGHASEKIVQRWCDPASHSCLPGTETPWWSIPGPAQTSESSTSPTPAAGRQGMTAVLNVGEPLATYTLLSQAISADQWAGLNQAANDRLDRQYSRRGTPTESSTQPSARPLTEITIPVTTLLRPEEPASDADFSSRLFRALTTGGGDISAAGLITRDHILKLWYGSASSALRANVRIALIDPQGETELPPGLTFQINGHPIPTEDGGLYIDPVDRATSRYMPGIIETVDYDLQRVARAAELHGRARSVIDFGRGITRRSPTAVTSEDFNQFIGVLTDLRQRIQSSGRNDSATAALLSGISTELSTFIDGSARPFATQIETARQAGMPSPALGTTMRARAEEELEAQRRAMVRPEHETFWQSLLRYHRASEAGGNATEIITNYGMANMFLGNQLEVSRELHEAFRGGRISLDDFQAGVSQAHTLGAIVGSINAVLIIATIGLGGPILGTAPSAGAVILYGGTSAAITTGVPMIVSSVYTSYTPLQGPLAQQIWMQGGYRSPEQIIGASALSFGIGAGLSAIGPVFNWFSNRTNAQLVRSMVVASAEGRPLTAIPNVQTTVVSPGVVEVAVTGQPGVIRVTQSGWQVVMRAGAGPQTVIMEEAWSQLSPRVAGGIESRFPALSGIQGTAQMQPQGGIPIRFGVTREGYFVLAPQAQNPMTLGSWGGPQTAGGAPVVFTGGGPGGLGGRTSPLLLPGGPTPRQLYSGEVIIDLQGGDTSFVRGVVAQLPGARGYTVESGAWIPGYQGITPTISPLTGGHRAAMDELDLLLQIARNSPRWELGIPAYQLEGRMPPILTPEQMTPFAQPPGVTLIPDPFFPASGMGGRVLPISIGGRPAQMDVAGLSTTTHPELWGEGSQIYLRRPFALQAASPAQAEAMGQEINRMLRPNGFLDLRLLRSGDRRIARTIAAQIPGAEVVEVDQRAIRTFVDSGYTSLPSDARQAEILRAAEPDLRAGGLGGGDFNSILRVYRPAAPAGGGAAEGQPAVLYRGTTYRWMAGGSSDIHDLGPGTYWSYEREQGVRFAQMRSSEAQRDEPGTVGLLLQSEVAPSDLGRVFDFYNNPTLRREWEAFVSRQPGGDFVLRGGSAQMYNAHFENWLSTRGMQLQNFDVIVGPDYIHGGSQVCIRDQSIAARVLAQAQRQIEPTRR